MRYGTLNMWQFAKKVNEDCRTAIRFILSRNIVCGKALSLKTVDENGNDTDKPIVFSEWSFVMGTKLQRKDFRFNKLLAGDYESAAGVSKRRKRMLIPTISKWGYSHDYRRKK